MKKALFALAYISILMSIAAYTSKNQQQKAERHDFVKHGDHSKQLKLGTYVVVGEFTTEEDVKKKLAELQTLKYDEVKYGYLSNKEAWCVYLGSGRGLPDAKKARDKYRQVDLFKDIWLLTVHD